MTENPQDKVTRVLYITPRSCNKQGDTFLVIQFHRPLPPTTRLRVQIGAKFVSALALQNPWMIHCLAPAGDTGTVDVAIFDGERELVREVGVFSYINGLEDSKRRSIRGASTVPATDEGSKKPGDPTRPASNWWMFHRDLEHTSRVPQNGIIPLTKLWHRTFVGALSFTQPIMGDNTLLVGIWGNGDEAFAALDPETGNILWTRTKDQNGGATVSGTPVAVNNRVYFVEAHPETMQLTCLKIADGSEVWLTSLPSWSQSGLAAAFGNIYLLTRDGVLRAHNAETGTEVWQAPGIDVGEYGQTLSSPAIGFGNIYVGSHQGLRVFDAITGAPKWSAIGSPLNGNASPLLVYDTGVGNPAVVTIGAEDNILRAYHATSGSPLWEYAGNRQLWSTTPATNDGKIYLMQERTIVELDAVTGGLIKMSPDLGGTIAAAPTVAEDHLFAIMRDDRLVALKVATFDLALQRNIPSYGHHHPSVEEGRLFIFAAESAPFPAPRDTIHAFHKGCLIATVAYGSPLAPPVAFLRSVRDKRLRQSARGSALIDALEGIYYKFSPHISEAMHQYPLLKRIMRWFVVAPIVYLLMIIIKQGTLAIDRIRSRTS